VQATLEELNMSCPEPDTEEAQIAAARVMCRHLLAGDLAARELATWAQETIGHDGAARLQPIVQLDACYDDAVYAGVSLKELDGAVRREAESLLAGEPLLGQTSQGQSDEVAAGARNQGRLLSVLARIREVLSP
jgi:hypothetical protein